MLAGVCIWLYGRESAAVGSDHPIGADMAISNECDRACAADIRAVDTATFSKGAQERSVGGVQGIVVVYMSDVMDSGSLVAVPSSTPKSARPAEIDVFLLIELSTLVGGVCHPLSTRKR